MGINPIRKYPEEIRKGSKGPSLPLNDAISFHKKWVHRLDEEMQSRAEEALSHDLEKKQFFNRVLAFTSVQREIEGHEREMERVQE